MPTGSIQISDVPACDYRRLYSSGLSESELPTDEFGFLKLRADYPASDSEKLSRPSSLARAGNSTLVTGPAWIGKTWIAERMAQFSDSRFGPYFHHSTCRGVLPQEHSCPPWFEEWMLQPEEDACWIVDSLDYAEANWDDFHQQLLTTLRELGDHKWKHLSLVVFCRDNRIPGGFESELEQVSGGEFSHLSVAPPSADVAKSIVGVGAFEKVTQCITRCGLQAVARYPVVLDYLSGFTDDVGAADLTEIDIWKGVLEKLIDEPPAGKPSLEPNTSLKSRFEIAASLGAFVMLTGQRMIRCELVELLDPDGQSEQLSRAGSDAFKTNAFITSDEGYRFREEHICEWFAAFHFAKLPPEQAVPAMLSAEDLPADDYVDILRLVPKLSENPSIWRDAIRERVRGVPAFSHLHTWELQDSVLFLEQLEELVAESKYIRVNWDEPPEYLSVDGFVEELVDRITDDERSSEFRCILVVLARELRLSSIAPELTEIALSASNFRLKSSAVSAVIEIGSVDDLWKLEPLISKTASGLERRISAQVLIAFAENGIWGPSKLAAHMPAANSGAIDMTHVVGQKIAEGIEDDAIPVLRTLWATHDSDVFEFERNFQTVLLKALERAVEDTENAVELSGDLLVEVLVETNEWLPIEIGEKLTQALVENQEFRRELYTRQLNDSVRLGIMPTPEDIDWLLDLLTPTSSLARTRMAWKDLALLSTADSLAPRVRRNLQLELEANAPEDVVERASRDGVAGRGDRARESSENERRDARHVPPAKSLEEELNRIITKKDLESGERLRQVSALIEPNYRPPRVHGDWLDVDEDVRDSVARLLMKLLAEVEPSPVNKGLNQAILLEGSAVDFVVAQKSDWLNQRLLNQWLPTVIQSSVGRVDNSDVVRGALAQDPAGTRRIVEKVLRRELQSANSIASAIAQSVPRSVWSSDLLQGVISDASNNIDAESTSHFVAAVGRHAEPELARKFLLGIAWESWGRTVGNGLHQCFVEAVDGLIRVDPEIGWQLTRDAYDEHGIEGLKGLRALSFDFRGVEDLNAEDIREFFQILVTECPFDDDPPLKTGFRWVSTDESLRNVRDRLFRVLILSKNVENDRLLDCLSETDSELERRVRKYRTQQYLDTISRRDSRDSLPPARRISQDDAIALLTDSRYRLVRDANDLRRVLVEILEHVDETVGEDITLLYDDDRKKRHETILSDYVKGRLRDLLPPILGRSIASDRESVESYKTRTDLKVVAPTVRGPGMGPDLATVIIELKWSRNQSVSKNLSEQLGKQYLTESDYQHGIYLVAWEGGFHWSYDVDPPLYNVKRSDLARFSSELERKAREYTTSDDPGTVSACLLRRTCWDP